MDDAYQLRSPMVQRGASSGSLAAPTASMIDPHLENQRISNPQLSHNYAQTHLRGSVTQSGIQNDIRSSQNSLSDRVLPSIEISDESIDDAYVDFIMYCNPSIRNDIDTAELRRGFRSPPKSDGKSFSPFTLFELISKLESKVLKTWTQLVIELGVEPPDTSKNQSTQKVQQYAVRLKRWLHAFHVDAFFHYCLGVPNAYYTDRPTANDPSQIEHVRDGVPPEEDLALRALLPEWRPKRGRRKAEDVEAEGNPNPKRAQHQRASSAEFFNNFDEQYSVAPQSALPWSAHPNQTDAWAAAQVAIAPKTPSAGRTPITQQLNSQLGQHIRWRLNERENTPTTPYPQSAITPRHGYSASPFDEPRSAIPSSAKVGPMRSRKRHGPAVSSAWSASGSTATGKLRGRPPSNRSVQEGPFSTFPANPVGREIPKANNTASYTQSINSGQNQLDRESNHNFQPPAMVSPPQSMPESLGRKPGKLQLQVPENTGGPVRLATPPTVLINGETDRPIPFRHERRSSADFFNQIDEVTEDDIDEDGDDASGQVDWKRRALLLKRMLQEKEEELKALKRRVLEAVM